MVTYRTLMEMNRKEIFGETITDSERGEATAVFLKGICAKEDIRNYKKRMGVNFETDHLYPDYYIPPYNGNKKLRLIQGDLPKTNLLYANYYELEILRLLCGAIQENETVKEMIDHTLQRLRQTCFGTSCTQGECLAAGISVLRLLVAVKPDDPEWMDRLLNPLGALFLSFNNSQAAAQKGIPVFYLLMALTDINNEKTRTWISQKKEWLSDLLRRGWITGRLSNGNLSEGDTYNVMRKYIIRNALGTLPEYKDISQYEIYVSDKDGRCYCSI